jgi:hypothetical protein
VNDQQLFLLIKDRFDYDEAGFFRPRKTWVGTKHKVGEPVLPKPNMNGYLEIKVAGRTMKCHRLVFLWHNGFLPEEIDHINGQKCDNRIENLRPATRSQNRANIGKHKNNSVGFRGVYIDKGLFKAQIGFGKKRINIGRFKTSVEAALAYNEKALQLFGEFATLNKLSEGEAA